MDRVNRKLGAAGEYRRRHARPLVTLSYAQSIDGSLAQQAGTPTAISGPQSLTLTHQLRAAHAAILVGIGTLLADDPQLSVRHAAGENPQVVIVDSRLRTPPRAALFSEARRPWVFSTVGSEHPAYAPLSAAGARIFTLPASVEGVDIEMMLDRLAAEEIDSLMVEGGVRLLGSFLRQRLAQQVVITIAPRFIGGYRLLSEHSDHSPGNSTLPRLENSQVIEIGADWILSGELT